MKRIAYTTMPYKTGLRLLGVARNPANGFPARLLGRRYGMLSTKPLLPEHGSQALPGKRIGSADQGTDEEPSELRYKDVLDDARVFNHLQESPTSQCPGPDHHPPAAPARTPEELAPRQRGSTRPGKDKPGWRRRRRPGVPSASECRFCPIGREY